MIIWHGFSKVNQGVFLKKCPKHAHGKHPARRNRRTDNDGPAHNDASGHSA